MPILHDMNPISCGIGQCPVLAQSSPLHIVLSIAGGVVMQKRLLKLFKSLRKQGRKIQQRLSVQTAPTQLERLKRKRVDLKGAKAGSDDERTPKRGRNYDLEGSIETMLAQSLAVADKKAKQTYTRQGGTKSATAGTSRRTIKVSTEGEAAAAP